MTDTPAHSITDRSRTQLAALVASRLGLLRLLRAARLNRGLLVLAYHRIGEAHRCPVDEQLFGGTAADFHAHVRAIRRWARIADLDQMADYYERPRALSEPLVLLTFDDAYRDNYQTVFPILRREGVTAMFAVPTGLLEQRHIPWWDRIAFAVKHARRDEIRLDYPPSLALSGVRAHPETVILRLLRFYKQEPHLDLERFLAALEIGAEACAATDPNLGELFTTWDALREMASAEMSLASHTHSHRILAHLSDDEQYRELEQSQEWLYQHTGVKPNAVVYPVGGRSHFNDNTRRAMRALGYRFGFSHYGGWNPVPADPYDIRRVRMDRTVDTEMLQATVSLPRWFAD